MASIVSYAKLDPDVSLDEIGLEAQAKHVDASEAAQRTQPRHRAKRESAERSRRTDAGLLVSRRALDHRPEALDFADDVPKDWQQVSGWHKDVMASKSILPWTDADVAKTRRQFDELVERAPHFAAYYAHHLPFHAALAALSL